jgi:hypothetical protein
MAAVLVVAVLVVASVAVLDSTVVSVVGLVGMVSAAMVFTVGMADSIQGITVTAGTGMGAATTHMPATATIDLPLARRGRSPPSAGRSPVHSDGASAPLSSGVWRRISATFHQ